MPTLKIGRDFGESFTIQDTTGRSGPVHVTLKRPTTKGGCHMLVEIQAPREVVIHRDDVIDSQGTHGGEPCKAPDSSPTSPS